MIPIEKQKFENETVIMDGKYFDGCTFENCTIIFMGGLYGWSNCKFGLNIFQFKGPAWQTILFIKESGVDFNAISQVPQ